ncbi:MAG TPA: hypothetical protein VFY21_08305 [Xanthobacteraceae bacterium]|nr:hypothetical protein [Xanthobacteraceae bacterium]
MRRHKSRLPFRLAVVAFAAFAAAVFVSDAFAQQPPVRVRAEIVKVDGNKLFVKARDGAELTINVPDNVAVSGIVKIPLSDVKPGSYIGVSALPEPDGSQNALHVHIFPEALRGVAEGHSVWDVRPGSTMTNATVDQITAVGEGRTLTVKYKDGEKKIVVPAETPIVTYLPGARDELKPGAKIFIVAAQRQPDGSLNAARISVGRDGLTPPM